VENIDVKALHKKDHHGRQDAIGNKNFGGQDTAANISFPST
jgi:hypothetical protein